MLSVLALLAFAIQGPVTGPAPPDQPSSGPGGAVYPHATVRKSLHGEGARAYWIFEPADPRPEKAPLVLFLHGYGATNPRTYGAWIEHLARQGKIVVYPRFQRGLVPRPATFTRNTVTALHDALAQLETAEHVRPDLERVAVVGHSVGGLMAANLAAMASEEGLPVPRAVFAVQPGSAELGVGEITLADLGAIPTGTLILTLAGDADSISGDVDARRIYRESTSVPLEDKDFLLLLSDDHGSPPLRANHLSPLATDDRYGEEVAYRNTEPNRGADALDYYGTWKLFDALCDAAFDGQNRQFALGNTPEQRRMGSWSDGHPVREIQVRNLTRTPTERSGL